ncbi:MgtC/SapB family protein [Enterococcus termitis]|jgi:putative Mg2+ transporter-C (MgtC) family protein|uniref:Magnesium transporter MgtC n=1 Tax=Enterococcus termitis TaxID=332950 RepID=A0A1E5GD25_9ENTE|nr:MgtC/SapB family protein [Enterococcus termitis]OEG10608.1 magnesium transporter MgtC [Enterococcus termitis]
MSFVDITFRLVLSIIISGCIGIEREHKNRPAGIRTHILVCVGATVIALIQDQISIDALTMAQAEPALSGVIRSDQARLIAQVVSGVGFLGAGTIVVTQRSILGLTTAATIWAVACLGIAIGMGYYSIGIIGAVAIMIGLTWMKRIIKVPSEKKVEVKFVHKLQTKEFLNNYFEEKQITIKDVEFSVEFQSDLRIYNNVYTIELPLNLTYMDMIEDISIHKNVMKIKIVNV